MLPNRKRNRTDGSVLVFPEFIHQIIMEIFCTVVEEDPKKYQLFTAEKNEF